MDSFDSSNVDRVILKGKTVLMYAAQAGSIEIFNRLLEVGADPMAAAKHGTHVCSQSRQRGDRRQAARAWGGPACGRYCKGDAHVLRSLVHF